MMTIDVGTRIDLLGSAQRAQQWELTKGHLRASVALLSNSVTFEAAEKEREADGTSRSRWERFENLVEMFIRQVESKGLNE